MEKLRAIIVDDEKPGRENLKAILETYFEDIHVVGLADDSSSARRLISEHHLDIVFLDVELGAENGLDLLKSIAEPSFETIFVTAYDEYAVRAFRTQAADYLLKPIDIDDLQDAIQKVKVKITSKTETVRKEDNLAEVVVDAKVTGTFIKVITQDGYELVSVEDIIYLKSINYYTNIVLNDNREIITTKTLKEYQNLLKDANFFRIHNSYIINLKYLKGVISKESYYAKLVNDVQIGISRRRKDDFLSFLKNKSIKITKF